MIDSGVSLRNRSRLPAAIGRSGGGRQLGPQDPSPRRPRPRTMTLQPVLDRSLWWSTSNAKPRVLGARSANARRRMLHHHHHHHHRIAVAVADGKAVGTVRSTARYTTNRHRARQLLAAVLSSSQHSPLTVIGSVTKSRLVEAEPLVRSLDTKYRLERANRSKRPAISGSGRREYPQWIQGGRRRRKMSPTSVTVAAIAGGSSSPSGEFR